MGETRSTRWAGYGLAVLATVLSTLIRWPLFPLIGYRAPTMTFFPAIFLAAYFGGFGPGLLATILSGLGAVSFLFEPHYSLRLHQPADAFALGIFTLIGVATSALCESRLRSHRRITANERRYAVTLSSIGDAVIATDAQARITFLNPAAEKLTGWVLAEATGRPLADVFRIVNEQTRQPVEDPAAKVLRLGMVVGLANHTALLARDGRETPIDDCGAPIINDQGAIAGVVLVFHDASKERQAAEAEAFRRANERMELAVRGSNVGVFDLELPDGEYRRARRHYVNLWEQLGYDVPAADGRNALDEAHADDRARVEDAVRAYLADETKGFETELRLCHKDGSYRTILARGAAVRDAAGKARRFAGITIDITRLKLTEEALSCERDLLHTLMDNIPDMIYFKDTASRFLRINKSVSDFLGLPDPAQAIGKTDFDFFAEEHARPAYEDEQEIIRTGQPVVGKAEKGTRLDGSTSWASTTKMPFRDKEGRIIGTFGVTRDIAKLKLAEDALRESEQRWRSLTEALPQLVWSATPDGACDYFSTQWTEHTGVAEAQLLGWHWLETLHPEDREPTRQFWLESVAGRHPYDVEYRVRHRDGEYGWFKTRGVPIRDGSGNIVKWFGTCTDITDLRHAEQALRASERRFRTFVDHAADAFFLHGEGDAHVLDVNRQACESLGYTREELLRMTPADYDADVTPALAEDYVRRLAAGETIVFESRHRRKDGTFFPVEVRAKAFWEGGRGFFVALVRDMTERKQAEEALRESEERFRGTFENAAVGIAQTDPTGRILNVNEKFCSIVGYTRAEILQKSFADITHPEDLAASLETFIALMRDETPVFGLEKRYLRKDGSLVWVELFASLQRDAADKPANSIAVIQDISERKRLDAELRQAKEIAEAANRAKDEFLANVSHEIRTPMNAILGMTELTLETDLTENQRQCLKTVKSAADNLLRIINDLLDFSKIEAGKLELDPGDFLLRSAVADPLRALAVRAHKKGLELIYNAQPDVPDALIGDAGRLRQILLNLVGNAIKFTEEGEVIVGVEIDCDSAGDSSAGQSPDSPEVRLRFTVRDTGIGIPVDKQERIFRAFEQEDTSTTRKYGGTGLGLTITARLVALMGGKITVESEPGRGSTFAFTAGFARQPHTPQQVPARPPVLLHDLRVLVVDDNATNRRILEGWLYDWQMQPEAVGDALGAMDALWHGAATGRSHDLVLLDTRMPDTDGLALAAKIRERDEFSGARIILLTSENRSGDLARLRELQISAYLLKPVRQDELLATIYQVMSRGNRKGAQIARHVNEREQARLTAPAATPLRILVAEDNEFNAQLLEQLLGRRGHLVRVARNGREALGDSAEGSFDLLLLDLHMPELDGLQVARAIRDRERTTNGHLPIIALTARSRNEDRERCLAAGMDEYLAKPIQAADLWAAIDRVIAVHPPVHSQLNLLDPKVLLAACGDDAATLRKMCQTFQARLPDHLQAIENALRDGDVLALREAAHKLTGMVAVFSSVAGAAASQMEDLAEQGKLEEARPLATPLEAMAEELMRLVDGLSIETLRQRRGPASAPDSP
jgi:two-component system, sensor histidine kinase and response regulator